MGDTLTLACVSRGGNPLAKLVWFRNDQQVDVTYTTTGRESTNTLTFVVESNDNNAIYRCEATNSVSLKPMVAMVKLTVQCKCTFFGNIYHNTNKKHMYIVNIIKVLKCEWETKNI